MNAPNHYSSRIYEYILYTDNTANTSTINFGGLKISVRRSRCRDRECVMKGYENHARFVYIPVAELKINLQARTIHTQ